MAEAFRLDKKSEPKVEPVKVGRRGFLVTLGLGAVSTLAGCNTDQRPEREHSPEIKKPQAKPYWLESSLPIYNNVRDVIANNTKPQAYPQLQEVLSAPMAIWLNGEQGNVAQHTMGITMKANANGTVPLFTIYNIFNRDLGEYSAGGAKDSQEYHQYIQDISAGIGADGQAVIILEPDALPDALTLRQRVSNATAVARIDALRTALRTFSRHNSGVSVYIDAGNSAWLQPQAIASLLNELDAGTGLVTGISLNVANFRPTQEVEAYAAKVQKAMDRNLRIAIDTSRNGGQPGNAANWCNPAWARIGNLPSAQFDPEKTQYVWVKAPGESDGGDPAACQPNSPAAGEFSEKLLLGLLGY